MKPQRPHHPAVLAVAGLLSLAVGIGIGRFAYTPILPYMIAGLELDRSQAGLIASANYLGYFVGAVAAAWRAVPGDPRYWLLGALALSGLSTGAMALTTSLSLFLILRFAGGAAGALVMVLASSLVMDRLAAAGRDGWAAVMYAGVGSGIAISSLAVPAAASGDSDWQSPWFFSGALCLAIAIPVAVLLPRPQGPETAAARTGTRKRRAGLLRLILAYGLVGFGYVITATFVADMVRADPVLQPAEHLVWLCVGLTAAPSVALWGWAGRRWGNARAFAIGCLIEAVGVALSVLGGGIWPIMLAAGLLARRDLRGVDCDRPHRDPPPVRRRSAPQSGPDDRGLGAGPDGGADARRRDLRFARQLSGAVLAGRSRARCCRCPRREPDGAHERRVTALPSGQNDWTDRRIAGLLGAGAPDVRREAEGGLDGVQF